MKIKSLFKIKFPLLGILLFIIALGGCYTSNNIKYIQANVLELQLIKSAKKGDLKKVKALLAKGVRINAQDDSGKSALIEACIHNHYELAQLLLKKGANINVIADKTNSLAAIKKLQMKAPHIEAEEYRKQREKYFYNATHGKTALMYTVLYNNLKIADLLIKNGANVNIRDKDKKTALMYAAIHNHLKMAKLLINAGANLNLKDNYQFTALLYAIKNSHYDLSEFLIKKRANCFIKTEKKEIKKTTLEYAIDTKNKGIIKLILTQYKNAKGFYKKERLRLLKKAISETDINLIKVFLDIRNPKDDNQLVAIFSSLVGDENIGLITLFFDRGIKNLDYEGAFFEFLKVNNFKVANKLYKLKRFDESYLKSLLFILAASQNKDNTEAIVYLLKIIKVDQLTLNQLFVRLSSNNLLYPAAFFFNKKLRIDKSKLCFLNKNQRSKNTVTYPLKLSEKYYKKAFIRSINANNLKLFRLFIKHKKQFLSKKEIQNVYQYIYLKKESEIIAVFNTTIINNDLSLFKKLLNHLSFLGSKTLSAFLFKSIKYKSFSITKYLLKQGIDPNSSDQYEDTALIKAVKSKNINAVIMLIKNRANVNLANKFGQRALDFCIKNKGKIYQVLKNAGAYEGTGLVLNKNNNYPENEEKQEEVYEESTGSKIAYATASFFIKALLGSLKSKKRKRRHPRRRRR